VNAVNAGRCIQTSTQVDVQPVATEQFLLIRDGVNVCATGPCRRLKWRRPTVDRPTRGFTAQARQ